MKHFFSILVVPLIAMSVACASSTHRYAAHTLDDNFFNTFIADLRRDSAENNLTSLVTKIQLPVTVITLDGKKEVLTSMGNLRTTLNGQANLLDRFLRCTTPEDAIVRSDGIGLGNGALWIGARFDPNETRPVDRYDGLRVITINLQAASAHVSKQCP